MRHALAMLLFASLGSLLLPVAASAAGISVTLVGDVLTILGTDQADVVQITTGVDATNAAIVKVQTNDKTLTPDGAPLTFPAALVKLIVATMGGGNDVLINSTTLDSILSGGDGADILFGGSGNDSIDGGAGADILMGNAGDDVLTGGDGNDNLNGGPGKNTYNCGPDDVVFANAGDTINGTPLVVFKRVGP